MRLSCWENEREEARLAEEGTLCRDSMREPEHKWLRENRSAAAAHWNLLTGITSEQLPTRPVEQPPEPWRSFFAEVDALLTEDIRLHCCCGFVVTQLYNVARTTSDVDFLGVVPSVQGHLIEIAGKGTTLHRKHKLYLDAVTVATPPEDYELRLVPMFPGTWNHLRLQALEANDLALSKRERNYERDRDDVQQLARAASGSACQLKNTFVPSISTVHSHFVLQRKALIRLTCQPHAILTTEVRPSVRSGAQSAGGRDL